LNGKNTQGVPFPSFATRAWGHVPHFRCIFNPPAVQWPSLAFCGLSFIYAAGHGSLAVWDMNCFRSLGRRDGGFESHSGHGRLICVCAFFYFCIILCLGRGIATSWSPVQRVIPSVNDQETGKSALCSKVGARGKKSFFTHQSCLLRRTDTQ
jgi:hypothetical protein